MLKKEDCIRILIFMIIGLLVLIFSPFIGIKNFSLADLWKDEYRFIFFQIRIPRTLASFLGGGGLAIAGMVYQALFRNPLASPYTLGVSGGASLGAALCIFLGAGSNLPGFSLVSAGAFTGGVAAMAIVYMFAWSKESNSTTLLLAGVIITTVCSGFIMFIHQISSLDKAFQIMRWTIGGVDGTDYTSLMVMCGTLIVYIIAIAFFLPHLDLFLTGDDIAHSRGINVARSRQILIVLTAFAVGGIVSTCGPIGFVGIIAPHVCRMIIPGTQHRMLAFTSFITGGVFLTISDVISRIIFPPTEIPVGIITALCGGPFFLLLLIRRKKRLLM
ncbi:MAG: iron ABC transporter permease [Fibrobacter sp.]|nr:iron ABC transporter permease [Fibrobacter sp.]